MAIKTQKVVEDTGSEYVMELSRQFNTLLDTILAAADFATMLTDIEADVKKVEPTVSRPAAPRFPEY